MAAETQQEVHDSRVGPVIDVAQPSMVKAIISGFLWTLFGFMLVACGVVVFIVSFEGEGERSSEWYLFFGFGVLLLIFGWVLSTSIARSIAAASGGKLYFRAGPGGISVSYPGSPMISRLFLSYRIRSHDVPWKDIDHWYTYAIQKLFYTYANAVVFDHSSGAEVRVPTRFFQGSRVAIAKKIEAAQQRNLSPDSAPAPGSS
jgi:hypothetical protein